MAQEFYDQAAHSVLIDGVLIEDFFEGEGTIAFAPVGDLITQNRGLDGNALSLGSRRPGDLTIMLKPTSPSLAFLNGILTAQANGAPSLFNVTVTLGVQDVLSLTGCLLQDSEVSSGGPTMEARPFVVKASNYDKRE
ncbi:MAG: hypothetical protein JKY94_17820 [Rhodobacteraceae bacterium]|nr:hypothetical protein [Paracoccaceae bacterium]